MTAPTLKKYVVLMAGDEPLELSLATLDHCERAVAWQVRGGRPRTDYRIVRLHRGVFYDEDGQPVTPKNTCWKTAAFDEFLQMCGKQQDSEVITTDVPVERVSTVSCAGQFSFSLPDSGKTVTVRIEHTGRCTGRSVEVMQVLTRAVENYLNHSVPQDTATVADNVPEWREIGM